MKDERENGDYDIYTSFDKEDAESAISKADEFLLAMKKYLSETYGLVLKMDPENPSNL